MRRAADVEHFLSPARAAALGGRIRTVELWPGRRAGHGVIGRALVREAEASDAICH